MFDDFDGPAGSPPNPAYWSHTAESDWEIGTAIFVADNSFLDGEGHLVIQAVESSGGHSSGSVRTKGKLSLDYGTITARIKMPSGQGLWPAFWLLGADEGTTPWPECGEIDIIEQVSDSSFYYTTLHGPVSGKPNTPAGTQQAHFSGPIADLSTDFHDYWVTRIPDQITVGIDDQVLGTFTPESLAPGSQWVYNRPMYAILNLAVGGSWAGPPDASTVFPATMLVDSFRWDPL